MVRYLITGALSLVLGISMTSYYYQTTQTTITTITQACDEPQGRAPTAATGEIDTTYTPQGRRLAMPGSTRRD
jgi:hypothetical protein